MQSIEKNSNQLVDFSLGEITEILIKNQGIHEGFYNLSFQFKLVVGTVGPTPEQVCPGAMMGISRIGLSKTEEGKENIHTVNAAEVNPAPKKKSPKTKR